MDLLLHFKVNEGDENNINIQEYMLYGDVETKSEKCLVDEGDEVVLTEFPVPEFKNCTLMKKGDEGFYEYKDYRQGENAELAGGYAVSGILQQNKRFDFNYVNDQINGIVQDPFYKVETMGDYQIPMRVLDAYNDLYVATLATTEYIYYLHDSDDDFEICNKSFNELFSELKPSQTIFIEEVGDVIKTFGILDMKLDDISLKANCLNFE